MDSVVSLGLLWRRFLPGDVFYLEMADGPAGSAASAATKLDI